MAALQPCPGRGEFRCNVLKRSRPCRVRGPETRVFWKPDQVTPLQVRIVTEPGSKRQPGIVLKSAIGATMIALIFTLALLLASLLSDLLSWYFGVPPTLSLPVWVRGLGGALLLVGLLFLGWSARVRRPRDVVESSWLTFRKLFRAAEIGNSTGRSEPFKPEGPYAWVRNPMYFGAVSALVGGGALQASTTFLVWGLLMLLWFWAFLVPFEEKELAALFGESYADYARRVPKMFPYGRRYRPGP